MGANQGGIRRRAVLIRPYITAKLKPHSLAESAGFVTQTLQLNRLLVASRVVVCSGLFVFLYKAAKKQTQLK